MSEIFEKRIKIENGKEFVFSIPSNENIGCMISGGADSAILTYVLAQTIREENLGSKIYPITAELLKRPFNIRYSHEVLKKVCDLTGFQFEPHLIFPVPNYHDDMTPEMRTETMKFYVTFFQTAHSIPKVFNGITANPPIGAVSSTERGMRPADRDDPETLKERETKKTVSMPFVRFDKRDIALLYKKLGVIHQIFPLTRSCEGDAQESESFTKDCFDFRPSGEECWWCKERAYGFEGLI